MKCQQFSRIAAMAFVLIFVSALSRGQDGSGAMAQDPPSFAGFERLVHVGRRPCCEPIFNERSDARKPEVDGRSNCHRPDAAVRLDGRCALEPTWSLAGDPARPGVSEMFLEPFVGWRQAETRREP